MKYRYWLIVIIVLIVSILIMTDFIMNNSDYIGTKGIAYDDFLTLKNEYPHDTSSFTQGLFFYDDKMYESVRFI